MKMILRQILSICICRRYPFVDNQHFIPLSTEFIFAYELSWIAWALVIHTHLLHFLEHLDGHKRVESRGGFVGVDKTVRDQQVLL